MLCSQRTKHVYKCLSFMLECKTCSKLAENDNLFLDGVVWEKCNTKCGNELILHSHDVNLGDLNQNCYKGVFLAFKTMILLYYPSSRFSFCYCESKTM